MNVRSRFVTLLSLTVLLTASCAVDPVEDSNYSYDRVMQAWINTHFPGLKTYGDTGAYVLEIERGDGPAVTDSAYVCAHYTKRNLDQTITSTNIRQLAEQLGQYQVNADYGSDIWRVDQGYLPTALETVIKSMRGGGHATVALPYSVSSHDKSVYSAFSGTSEDDNCLIELTVDTVITDIYDYQERCMRAWFEEHYAVRDTAAEGLYFKKLAGEAETDTIAEGSSVKVRYIGRRLDGQVFDTNIEDTAKFYRIWKDGGSYDALSVSFYKDDPEKLSENSVVDGFAKAVSLMNYGETAVTLFNSTLGYGEKGSAPAIPEYAPLIFWLYIEPKN